MSDVVESESYSFKTYRCEWQVQLGAVDQYDQNFTPYEIASFPTREAAQVHLDEVAEIQPGSKRLVPKNAPHGYCSAALVYREIVVEAAAEITALRDKLASAIKERDEARAKANRAGVIQSMTLQGLKPTDTVIDICANYLAVAQAAEARARAAEADRDGADAVIAQERAHMEKMGARALAAEAESNRLRRALVEGSRHVADAARIIDQLDLINEARTLTHTVSVANDFQMILEKVVMAAQALKEQTP